MGRLRRASSYAGLRFGRLSCVPVLVATGISVFLVCAGIAMSPATASAAGQSEIVAAWVENVTSTSARMLARINPNGLETTYRFEYLNEAAYQANLGAGREAFFGAVAKQGKVFLASEPPKSFEATALSPATKYRYRVTASNLDGVAPEVEHEFTTEETGKVFQLPDGRAWELVSPVDKGGGAIALPEALFGGGDIQAAAVAPSSAAGPFVTYGSSTAFGAAAGAPPASQYVSRRSGSGWITENVSTPLESGAYGDEPDGAPYRLFSTDLSRSLLFGGLACRGGLAGCPAPNPSLPGSGAPAGYMAYYLRESANGALASLLGPADLAHGAVSGPNFELELAAATPDLSHVVLSTCAALTAEATEVSAGPGQCDREAPNLYEWSAAGLRAINLLPNGVKTAPGAAIAAPIGAVSGDGSRVYWSEGGDLYLRQGSQTLPVDESAGGGGAFQTASADGEIGLFTKAGHLYRFDAGTEAALDLTPSGGVQGVLGASADGAYVYYQDATGLELWHAGVTTTIAAGADAALPSDYPPASGTARVSADGLHLAFLSEAALTLFDNTDANTGQPDVELYLYGPPAGGAAAGLVCASCNPTGERPEGSASIPGALVNGTTRAYKPRVLSASGLRVFFDSDDGLGEKDDNETTDVYEWESAGVGDCRRSPGCLGPISSGTEANGGATFLDATADGSDVFFATNESLLPRLDPGSVDVYDARVDGGIPDPPEPFICLGDNCQPLPAPPDDPTPGTLTRNSGNAPLRVLAPKARKHRGGDHRKRKHGKGRRRGRGER